MENVNLLYQEEISELIELVERGVEWFEVRNDRAALITGKSESFLI